MEGRIPLGRAEFCACNRCHAGNQILLDRVSWITIDALLVALHQNVRRRTAHHRSLPPASHCACPASDRAEIDMTPKDLEIHC